MLRFRQRVALRFGHAGPDPVQLAGPEREAQALEAAAAATANRLGVGHRLKVIGRGRHWEEQVRIGGPARGDRPSVLPDDHLCQPGRRYVTVFA